VSAKAELLPMVHAERRSLAGFLDTVPEEQWRAPSWCDKWTVQDLVGHLTAAGNITAPHFLRRARMWVGSEVIRVAPFVSQVAGDPL